MSYTHRNGEEEAPTVMGIYWFKGHSSGLEKTQDVYRFQRYPETGDWVCIDTFESDYAYRPHELEGQWWGPIVPPWETP